MLTGRMRSATTRHATCTGLVLTSQATCLARIPWWRMRRWMTELLKACGWVTTSAPPCSGCTRSSCEKWYVSAIPVISTTFCLSYVRRISLTASTESSNVQVRLFHSSKFKFATSSSSPVKYVLKNSKSVSSLPLLKSRWKL